jgi:hypothetical protein
MSFSATMFWHCKCGAEVHVAMECEVSDERRSPLPVRCWSCEATLGQVPALDITAPTAQAAVKEALTRWVLALH